MVEKIKKIYSLLSEGKSYSQISKELNISKSLVAFYAKKNENSSVIKKMEEKEKQKEEYEKLICSLSQECSNLNQICRMLNKRSTNKNYEYILNILKKHNVEISSLKIDKIINRPKLLKEDIFCLNSKLKNNSSLREKLFKYALKEHKCEMCGNHLWNDSPIPLEVHHINGDRTDNREENLQLLCPNCHAQTDNYCGKNKKSKISTKKQTSNVLHKKQTPSKETLILNFKEKGSFKGVGKIYHVSDNAVKKWFKKENLPQSSVEMRNFIISQFGEQPQWYEYRKKSNYSKSVEKTGIKVDVFLKNGEFIKTFNSINEAEKYTKVNKNTIRRALSGKEIKNKDFIFKYKNLEY